MHDFLSLAFAIVITLLCMPVIGNNNDIVQVLHRKLEEALTKNSTLLFQLQKLLLFNPTPNDCYDVEVIVEVGTLNETAQSDFRKCTNYTEYNNCYHGCEYNWTAKSDYYVICPDDLDAFQTSQVLLGYQTTSFLQAFDPLFYHIITAFSNVNRKCRTLLDHYTRRVTDITMRLFIDTLDILPSYCQLSEAEMILLSLAKGYARTNGRLTEIQYGDILVVKQSIYCQSPFDSEPWQVSILVLAIFYSVNMVVLGLVIKYLHLSFHWLHTQDKQTKDLYVITATIVALLNCSSFIVRILSTRLEIIQSIALLIYTVPIVGIEIPIVMYHTCKRAATHRKKLFYRCLHFFAGCHIIWFIHRLVTDAIIATLNFITAPAQTIGMVSIYISMISGTVITLKVMLSEIRCERGISQCSKHCCKQCLSLSCVLFIGISLEIVMVSAGLLYIVLVNYGLKTSGAGGFLLSFVPPVAVLILGVYIKKERFHKLLMTEDSPRGDEQDTSAVVVEMDDILQEKEAKPSLVGWDKSMDIAQQSNSNKSIMTVTKRQGGLGAMSASLVEPLLNESAGVQE